MSHSPEWEWEADYNPRLLGSLKHNEGWPHLLSLLQRELNSLVVACLNQEDPVKAEQLRIEARVYKELYDRLSRKPEEQTE